MNYLIFFYVKLELYICIEHCEEDSRNIIDNKFMNICRDEEKVIICLLMEKCKRECLRTTLTQYR